MSSRISYKMPMIKIDIISCKKCKGAVKPSIFKDMYSCDQCNIITGQVNIIVSPVTGIINVERA